MIIKSKLKSFNFWKELMMITKKKIKRLKK